MQRPNIHFAKAPPSWKAPKASKTSLPCPECGSGNSGVINSRVKDDSIRRRRYCQDCNCRFTTFETIGTDEDTVSDVVAAARSTIGMLRQQIEELEGSLASLERRAVPTAGDHGR